MMDNYQKQKIYKITKENIDEILPKLNLRTQAISYIKSYVMDGNYVIAHTDIVHVKGWNGAGFIAINPNTGDGVYMISGGMNGGFIDTISSLNLFIVSVGLNFGVGFDENKAAWAAKISHISTNLAIVGTIISMLKTATDVSLSSEEKFKIILANAFTYFISELALRAIFFATPIGILLTAMISMVILTMISVVVSHLVKYAFIININYRLGYAREKQRYS